MIQFQQRSFKGENFRPLPDILNHEKLNLFCALTSWGPSDENQKFLDFMLETYELLSSDSEKTNPYQALSSLSLEENTLRSLLFSCNDWIFKNQNQEKDYVFGYEIFVAVLKEGLLTFCQVGQPFVYLDRKGLELQSLGAVLDFSALFAEESKRLDPLPSRLIGLKPDIFLPVFSLPIQEEDRLILLCKDLIPPSFLQSPSKKRGLKNLSELLSMDETQTAFWLGQLSF